MGLPESAIIHPENYSFSEADSILLFSLLHTYTDTGKLPDDLYQLYSKNNKHQALEAIENFRREELKCNKVFVNSIYAQIIDIQSNNLNNFIENEINSVKSLRYTWKSQDDINQILGETLPEYINETEVAKIYNDSCASYFNFISHFRDNGVIRFISKTEPTNHLNTIETDIRGFLPTYQFDNSSSHVSYQILATIERAQDVLFKPINWFLELLPNWLTITITILLLILFILAIKSGNLSFTLLDSILLIISITLLIWGDPYSEVRESMNHQVRSYYENKINAELNHLDNETNLYYDNIIKNFTNSSSNRTSRKPTRLQASGKENNAGNGRTNVEENLDGNCRTDDKGCNEVSNKADSIQ